MTKAPNNSLLAYEGGNGGAQKDYAQAALAFCKPVRLCAFPFCEIVLYEKNKNIAKDGDQ